MTNSASLRCAALALWCVVAAGCAELTNDPTQDALTTATPVAATTTPSAGEDAATPEPALAAPVAALPSSTADAINEPLVSTEPDPAAPLASTADVVVASADPAVAPATPAVQSSEAVAAPIPSVVASPTPTDALDFTSLVTRLRKTKAISLLTKVAVKNESDDLLAEFRAYHAQPGFTTLAELRRSYDSLFHKLYSLLQDADPPLARDIDRSRAAIWELLADPRKFSASRLMAGA